MTPSFQSTTEGSVPLEPKEIHDFIKNRVKHERKMMVHTDLQSVLVQQAKIGAYHFVRLALLGIPFDAADDAPLGPFSCVMIDPFDPSRREFDPNQSLFGDGPITTSNIWNQPALKKILEQSAQTVLSSVDGTLEIEYLNTDVIEKMTSVPAHFLISHKADLPFIYINGMLQQPDVDYRYDATGGKIIFDWKDDPCKSDDKKTAHPNWIRSIRSFLTRLWKPSSPR